MAKIDAVDETEWLYTAFESYISYIFAYIVYILYIILNIYISVILSVQKNKHKNYYYKNIVII